MWIPPQKTIEMLSVTQFETERSRSACRRTTDSDRDAAAARKRAIVCPGERSRFPP